MGQRDYVGRPALQFDVMDLPDDLSQFVEREETADGELADGQYETGLEYLHLGLQPGCTVSYFGGGRYTVTAFGGLARKAATDRCHVDMLAEGSFVKPNLAEPAEQGFARGPGERAVYFDLSRPGGLSHEQYC